MKSLKFSSTLGILPVLFSVTLFAGCQGDERLTEKAQVEGRAEDDLRKLRAAEMEKDLALRLKLYHSVAASFEGTAEIMGKQVRMYMELIPTQVNTSSGRVRTIEEVQEDLVRLSQSIRLGLSTEGGLFLMSCNAKDIKMDLKNGTLGWVGDSERCSSAISIYLSEGNVRTRDPEILKSASLGVADQVYSSEGSTPVKMLVVVLKSSSTGEEFQFELRRKP